MTPRILSSYCLIIAALLAPHAAHAQGARLQLDHLNKLAEKATETVDVSADTAMLKQAAGFLDYLDKRTTQLKAGLEENRRKKEAALAKAQGMEYYRVESIYKDMGNLTECQIQVFENSRKSFMSILQKSW